MDMIPTPTGAGPDGFVPHVGGAVFNTAIALGRLGAATAMLTGLSSDLFGQQLRGALQASQVDTRLIIASDRLSTLAFVHLVDGNATYLFFDENSAGRMLAPADMPALGDDISALFFGGISLACEPCADAYAALMQREAPSRVTMLDPNVRPGFIKDPARYRARLDGMFAQADIVKVSDDDLHWMMPGSQSLKEKVASILSKGVTLVILTRGGDGAVGYLRDGSEIAVAAQKAVVVDTVGAGDTFNAGVLARLAEMNLLDKAKIKGLSARQTKEILTHGAKVAAVTVSRAGANPPWASEL